ncbi:hypothetical protein MSG28_001579 [Choristoneura fumiferana]|uniref:Uncharacterized protein n=1 Tax=Choristoneura fumiferana TaxID=7141 RepID=A0ACC0KV60_CHOFU|nr:hypothetical protein MSG28_001579 [Choristoneura fumiferana]
MLRGCEMGAGAGGAGSIFQGAQHDAGENSGVGPLPADINMSTLPTEPPSTIEEGVTLAQKPSPHPQSQLQSGFYTQNTFSQRNLVYHPPCPKGNSTSFIASVDHCVDLCILVE